MEENSLLSSVEALVFASGAPVSASRLAQALNVSQNDVEAAAKKLSEIYSNERHGISFIKLNDSYQFCTKKNYGDIIRNLMDLKRNSPLSSAAMEVLAVIAYNQPVTKSFIEQVRGVDCSRIISALSQKELIEEKGRLELPGKPIVYGTTENFLRCFGIKDISELPSIGKSSSPNNLSTEKISE